MDVSFLQRPITICIIFFTTPRHCQGSSLLILVSQMISSCKIIILSSWWWSYPYHVIAPNPKRTQRAMIKQRAKKCCPKLINALVKWIWTQIHCNCSSDIDKKLLMNVIIDFVKQAPTGGGFCWNIFIFSKDIFKIVDVSQI